jgi:hypothetical protein
MEQLVNNQTELDFLVQLIAPRPVWLVTLAPSPTVCVRRNATRVPEEYWEFDGYDRLDADLRRELGHVGWWFDTSSLTPEATAELLILEAGHHAPLNLGDRPTPSLATSLRGTLDGLFGTS